MHGYLYAEREIKRGKEAQSIEKQGISAGIHPVGVDSILYFL